MTSGNGPGHADFYDVELRRHHVHVRAAADDHVLDIGCGAGLTTREVTADQEAIRAHLATEADELQS